MSGLIQDPTARRIVYAPMQPPEAFPAFPAMDFDQAVRHFRWFVGQAPERVQQLRTAYAATANDPRDLDFSGGSLTALWRWVAARVEVVPALDAGPPSPAWARRVGDPERRLSPATLALAVDAGFYLAGVFRERHATIHWELWTRTKGAYWNRPVLAGFGPYPFVPHDHVAMGMWRLADDRYEETHLLKTFATWEQMIGP